MRLHAGEPTRYPELYPDPDALGGDCRNGHRGCGPAVRRSGDRRHRLCSRRHCARSRSGGRREDDAELELLHRTSERLLAVTLDRADLPHGSRGDAQLMPCDVFVCWPILQRMCSTPSTSPTARPSNPRVMCPRMGSAATSWHAARGADRRPRDRPAVRGPLLPGRQGKCARFLPCLSGVTETSWV